MLPDRWRKLGLVFQTAGDRPWSRSFAQVPTALPIDGGIRVFYSTRDDANRTSTGFFDVLETDPTRVVRVHPHPVLGSGTRGAFDDCGAMGSAVVRDGSSVRLYYQGWNVRTTVPFHTAIGLAISRDEGLSFERYATGPIIDRSPADPFFCATPTVVRHGDWRMWYTSGVEWRTVGEGLEPRYHIRQARSADGITWVPAGVALDLDGEAEGGLARPAVVPGPDGWRMWFCTRGWQDYRGGSAASYRIRQARSADGSQWSRCDDAAGIDVSPTGWDAEMTAYPNVVEAGGTCYLFYNGNGFGRSGIGVAVAE
jgi:hypothetical protein